MPDHWEDHSLDNMDLCPDYMDTTEATEHARIGAPGASSWAAQASHIFLLRIPCGSSLAPSETGACQGFMLPEGPSSEE